MNTKEEKAERKTEESDEKRGVINYQTYSHCENGQTAYINMGKSYKEDYEDGA